MARTITLDRLEIQEMRVTRENGQSVVVVAYYTLTTQDGTFPVKVDLIMPTTAGQRSTLNTMWDQAVSFIKSQEGIP